MLAPNVLILWTTLLLMCCGRQIRIEIKEVTPLWLFRRNPDVYQCCNAIRIPWKLYASLMPQVAMVKNAINAADRRVGSSETVPMSGFPLSESSNAMRVFKRGISWKFLWTESSCVKYRIIPKPSVYGIHGPNQETLAAGTRSSGLEPVVPRNSEPWFQNSEIPSEIQYPGFH